MKERQLPTGRIIIFWLVILALAIGLAACKQAIDTSVAPEIIAGQDVCDRCGMLISEEKFAAAYWTTDGEPRRFDDIGGMFAHYHEVGEDVDTFWVHDYLTGEWIRAEDASYVLDPSLTTPMGFGVAACAEEAQAQALAAGQEGAVVVSFADMIAIADAGEMEAGSMRQHNPDHDHAADMADEDHMSGMEMDHAMESDK
ncbi:MAG: nitrous oxide reductase accessory protein NosL [Anaerolineae bacterium]|nr:nitrous oxide reductase accessory protein NosL [Anaerolineae bacterium]